MDTDIRGKCGHKEFIRFEATSIVEISIFMEELIDDKIDDLIMPEYLYKCNKCGEIQK